MFYINVLRQKKAFLRLQVHCPPREHLQIRHGDALYDYNILYKKYKFLIVSLKVKYQS